MARTGFNDGGKMIALVAPHRPYDGDVVDHASHVGKPIRNRNSRLAVLSKLAMAGNDRPLHFRKVIAKPDRINQFAGPFIVFGIKRIDVADAATHEQENDRLGLGLQLRLKNDILYLPRFRPNRSHCQPKKAAPRLVEQPTPGNSSTGINAVIGHSLLQIDKLIEVKQQPCQALQFRRIIIQICECPFTLRR